MHGFGLIPLAAKALIYTGFLRLDPGEAFHLGERGLQDSPIVGIVLLGSDPNNPTLPRGGDNPHFTAKLIVLVDFAFSQAFDLWGMNTVDLVMIRTLLQKNAAGAASYSC